MAYDKSDPRAALAGGTRTLGANVAPQSFEFDHREPDERSAAGSVSWWVRSQAIVYNHVRAVAGDIVGRSGQAEEYAVLLPDAGTSARIRAAGEERALVAPALAFVPAGDSEIVVETDATVVRVFAAATADDLCRRCANDAFYATPDPNVAPFVAWPDPPAGQAIRIYAVDEVPRDKARLGRIFRGSTFMINWIYPDHGARDTTRLSHITTTTSSSCHCSSRATTSTTCGRPGPST